jgi:hypothetical protein
MHRVAHGSTCPVKRAEAATSATADGTHAGFNLPAALDNAPVLTRFSYLFDYLQNDEANLLPESLQTLEDLGRLGDTMSDREHAPQFNSNIPSAYTYFGQFVDHDIVFSDVTRTPPELTDSCMLGDPALKPWSMEEVLARAKNKRSSVLTLDSVYERLTVEDPLPPRDGERMVVGRVTAHRDKPQGKDDDHDLPRGPVEQNVRRDRVATIGDKRNDQNLIVSQLHVAFLRAHNAIVKLGHSFEEARTLLRQHYHWVIIHDFLMKQVADPQIVNEVLSGDAPLYNPTADNFSLPLEFTVAAFRFGHSMIRSLYYLNVNYQGTALENLYTLTALSNNIRPTPGIGSPTLRADKIIEWEEFVRGGENVSRRIDTRLVDPLRTLLDEAEQPVACERRLATQDLKRGYMFRMPTGQSVARALNLPVLSADKIKAAAANAQQLNVLENSVFLERTPLWFYILAEASDPDGAGGHRLGPVGSRIISEVLIGLVRMSKDSILSKSAPAWKPSLGSTNQKFDLPDFLRLAGVLS